MKTDKKITVTLTEGALKLLIKCMEVEMHERLNSMQSMSSQGDGCRHTFEDKEEYINQHFEGRKKLKKEYEYMNATLQAFYKDRSDAAVKAYYAKQTKDGA